MRPPGWILDALGVEEEQVHARVGKAFKIRTAVILDEVHPRGDARLGCVGQIHIPSRFVRPSGVDAHDQPSGVEGCIGQPDGREPIARSNLDDVARVGDPRDETEELGGGRLEVPSFEEPPWLRRVMSEAFGIERVSKHRQSFIHDRGTVGFPISQ
jgi:hypothetical protein